ncbi:aspartate aminotransferase family protein [Candidatus Peregrinibacteria bacterium]|nr:aspartate aminotransferase family protein [Candidatus Peregrinibacteria bacterium]
MDQRELLRRAEDVIPGACLGAMHLPKDLRMVMVRGEGGRIYDADGKEYIDYVLGSGPLILGHSHPAVAGAVREQLEKGSTFYTLNEPAIRFAEVLTKAAPCGEAVRFQTTGSDAVFAALRLARAHTGRSMVLKFEGAFHGGHDVGQIPDCDGIPDGVKKDVLIAPFNDADAAIGLIDGCRKSLAAVLVEPLQRALKPQPGFLEAIRDVTRTHAIPLIFDEVVTGFRLAWGGAQERYGVVPDLACYGKIIGGGFPLSAVIGKREMLELADPVRKGRDTYCFLGGTLTGNPIACAAGLETLDILSTPGVYERLHALGNALRDGIRNIGIELGVPLQVLGDGPILQTLFIDPAVPLHNHRDTLQADGKKAAAFGHELIRRGIFCAPGGKMYLSLAHTDEDIDRTLAIAREALKTI